MIDRISYAIVPALFLCAAGYFFHINAPVAGGVCILVAFLSARN